MLHRALLAVLMLLGASVAHAQPATFNADRLADLMPARGVSSNFVQVMHAEGDSLWVGPLLTVTVDGGQTFLTPGRDALGSNQNQVFSIDVESPSTNPSVIWAGLAFDANGQPGAGGFTFSEDGGQTFTFRRPQLDSPDNQSVAYGVSTLEAAAITGEAGSAPTGIDYDPRTGDVWVAGGLSGLRRSTSDGTSWQRVVLPPDTLDAIFPDTSYSFFVGPPRQNRGWLNHVAFSVLVDATGTVWAGTLAGVNRSRPSDVTEGDDRIWHRFSYDGTPDGLTGDRVIALAEQPLPNRRNPIWMATWPFNQQASDRQRFGVTVTRDGGASFQPMLIGEQISDFAFRGGRVYAAAGQSGLLVSDDGGATWHGIRDFELADPNQFIRSNARVLTVETTPAALWVGTGDGLLRRPLGTDQWTLFRADVPVNPETPSDAVPQVDTYAYPNPFSPASDRVVRIRYELEDARDVEVRIFDFNMNLVRRIVDEGKPPGEQETVWDGTDDAGLRVANGPYFYTVDLGNTTARGKILLVE